MNKECEKEIKEMEQKLELYKKIREKLSSYFDFIIPDYVISDFIDNEDYHHFCLMVNIAVINNRLSKENGNTLKEKIKSLLNIKSSYEKLRVDCLY